MSCPLCGMASDLCDGTCTSGTTELPIETLNELQKQNAEARTLTEYEFGLLKEVFLRCGRNANIAREVSCASKAEELMDAISKRTGIGFEQYT